MTIEESSVVAAASNAAKFWLKRGGFKTTVLSLKKLDIFTLHLREKKSLKNCFENIKPQLLKATAPLTKNMEKRGVVFKIYSS